MHIRTSILYFFCFITFLNLSYSFAQANENEFVKYLDAAHHIYDESPELAERYLDSIPKPIEISIKGHLADYYQLKSLMSDRLNNIAEIFQNSLMTLKYAKIENKDNLAGSACIELFYNTYFIKHDTIAFSYLRNAQKHFEKANDIYGLAEVKQMYAYIKLENKEYAESNALILKHLQEYENIKDDSYYYMYALFILSSNYIHMDDVNNSHKYLNRLKTLERDTTITKYIYDAHKVSIYCCLAEHHMKNLALDSTKYYLKKSNALKYAMSITDFPLYFKLNADYYGYLNDVDKKTDYIDSLSMYESKLLKKNMSASLEINESLVKSENLLETESNKKQYNRNLAIILIVALGALIIFIVIGYKKFNKRISGYIKKENKSSYLKSINEKLKVKVVSLEQYILKIKDEMKMISSEGNPIESRKQIKELYKNIHLKSITELTNGESHLDLINDLNSEFFSLIKETYPELSESEIIICYYIFTGFKNKEIASFLNVSIRSVEGKRYRISKKVGINTKQTTLVEHLQKTFI